MKEVTMFRTRSLIAALSVLTATAFATPPADAGEFDGIRDVVRTVVDSVRSRHEHEAVATCHFEPGHYVEHVRSIWVEGHTKHVQVPPEVRVWRDACGHVHRRVVRPGYVKSVWVPGHYENRTVRTWVEGRYVCHDRRHTHFGHGHVPFRVEPRPVPRRPVVHTPRPGPRPVVREDDRRDDDRRDNRREDDRRDDDRRDDRRDNDRRDDDRRGREGR
jgi:hypothetical protein